MPGPPGPPGSSQSESGTTYVRWGKSNCQSISGTELVYDGIAVSSHRHEKGSGANHLCLVKNPEYAGYTPGIQNIIQLYPLEYENIAAVQNHNAPCAVCGTTRNKVLMIPGTITCPLGWTREYYGYIMTQRKDIQQKSEFICVDGQPDGLPGSAGHTEPAGELFRVEAVCGIIPCPPYNDYKEITCAVCTM